MIKVFITLLASLIAAPVVETRFFQDYLYSIDYTLYCSLRGLFYVLLAALCVVLAKSEHKLSSNLNAALILTLCFCMLITGVLNIIMANSDVYFMLKPWKSGDNGLTWKNIYLSIEVLTALIVGGNGLTHIISVAVCALSRWSGIIRHYFNTNQGKRR